MTASTPVRRSRRARALLSRELGRLERNAHDGVDREDWEGAARAFRAMIEIDGTDPEVIHQLGRATKARAKRANGEDFASRIREGFERFGGDRALDEFIAERLDANGEVGIRSTPIRSGSSLMMRHSVRDVPSKSS